MIPNLDNFWDALFRLALALLFGSMIGWQRQSHGSAAGLRTHILVCIAANLVTSVDFASNGFQGKLPAAVMTGVGFLGAGTILRSDKGDSVHGLTTAASVWATAGIGIALGAGGISTWLGVAAAIAVLITLSVVYQLEEFALRNTRRRSISVTIKITDENDEQSRVTAVTNKLKSLNIAVEGMRQAKTADADQVRVHLTLHLPDNVDPQHILTMLSAEEFVVRTEWDL